MDNSQAKKQRLVLHRKHRVRKLLKGSPDKPRMSVFKSSAHLYVQLIDDTQGVTLASISTIDKRFKNDHADCSDKKTAAQALGTYIAKLAAEKQIQKVIFDRGPCKYHGLIKELAEAARTGGLLF